MSEQLLNLFSERKYLREQIGIIKRRVYELTFSVGLEKTKKSEYVTSIVTVLRGQGQKYRSSISDKRKIVSPAEALGQV